MIIFGIDPGSVNCGWGAISWDGQKAQLIEYGVLKAKKMEDELPKRIGYIYNKIIEKINTCKPDIFCLESVFFSKNPQSLIKLSHARAAAMLAGVNSKLEIVEYSPNEVKKSVVGKGHASKEQVKFMVQKIINIKETNELFDATDALAVALCHAFRGESSTKKSNSWKNFIKDNPTRVK
ncbi:crossover junction endodeoxyribonuclease RuvC [Candidatus Kapabacteria bacterium]|nr:crossover junction endodeoxyribonuclease RuvC [Candidatus Kapabacteria bacterium]